MLQSVLLEGAQPVHVTHMSKMTRPMSQQNENEVVKVGWPFPVLPLCIALITFTTVDSPNTKNAAYTLFVKSITQKNIEKTA